MLNVHKNLRGFDQFRLDIENKFLWHRDVPVDLPLKTLELLCLLVEHQGEVVSKERIWRDVWNDAFIEETNLTHNVYLLRKAFKEHGEKDPIQTVPRRGYRFKGEVREIKQREVVIERHAVTRTLIEDISGAEQESQSKIVAQTSPSAGRRAVVTIAGVVLLTAVLAGFAAWQFNRNSSGASAVGIKSIAILPLKSFSEKSEDEELRLRITDALITKLGNLREITVRPTNSVGRFTREGTDAVEAGRELEVDAVLDGRIQTEGENLRVTFQLISVRTGEQLWSGQFDGKANKILNLQDAIAAQILPRLSKAPILPKNATANAEAYEAYLRGRYWYHKRNENPDNYRKSLAEFERAISLDPNYALAYTGLADAYARRANNSTGAERIELYEKAKLASLKALALDENLAEAHASLGWLRRIYDWDWQNSEKHLKKAVELSPSNADHHRLYVSLLITLGRTAEAVEEAVKARDLDPVLQGPTLAFALLRNSQYDEAIKEYAKALELNHNPSDSRRGLTLAYLGKGMYAEVIELIGQAPEDDKNDFSVQVSLASAYFHLGDKKKVKEILRDLESQRKQDPEKAVRLAYLYSDMGRKDEAIALLKMGLENRDDRLMWIKGPPVYDSLRDDPRFQEILRKMNLPK